MSLEIIAGGGLTPSTLPRRYRFHKAVEGHPTNYLLCCLSRCVTKPPVKLILQKTLLSGSRCRAKRTARPRLLDAGDGVNILLVMRARRRFVRRNETFEFHARYRVAVGIMQSDLAIDDGSQ